MDYYLYDMQETKFLRVETSLKSAHEEKER